MKDRIFLKVMVAVDVLLLSCVVLAVVYFSKRSSNIQPEVLGTQDVVEERLEEFTVPICNQGKCMWLSSESVVLEGIVDRNAVYQRVLTQVIPYFEQNYGGKTAVQNRAGSFVYWKEDYIPNLSNIFDDVYRAFVSKEDDYVEVSIEDLPGTDGRYAPRYIEVDNSKQKLYVWVNGVVQKEILLSGPKVGYEVYGVFPIVDKGEAPIAPTGDYMPYWMAFYYSPKQEAWYGLHGLIWWYDDDGNKEYEPESNIGVRRSGGCIRMLVEDAKYIYDIFEKGDLVLIHE